MNSGSRKGWAVPASNKGKIPPIRKNSIERAIQLNSSVVFTITLQLNINVFDQCGTEIRKVYRCQWVADPVVKCHMS